MSGSSKTQGTDQVLLDTAAVGEAPFSPQRRQTHQRRKELRTGRGGTTPSSRFCEEVLRGAGKLVDNSIKEGTPDYVFYAPGTRNRKAVGAFKALTLREDGTRQRWIPRRKVLAELRLALKLGVPLILFVQNFANGRIWAKVLPVEELKEFTGLTTPLCWWRTTHRQRRHARRRWKWPSSCFDERLFFCCHGVVATVLAVQRCSAAYGDRTLLYC